MTSLSIVSQLDSWKYWPIKNNRAYHFQGKTWALSFSETYNKVG